MKEEEQAVKLIMADVLRLMHRAGESGRAARLRAGRIPEGPDFNHFAAHVGGAVRVVPLGCAAVRGPTTFGMLEQEGAMHVELEQTHMQGETSEAWPVLKRCPTPGAGSEAQRDVDRSWLQTSLGCSVRLGSESPEP